MGETDRWGERNDRNDDSVSAGSSSLWIGIGLLLLVLVVGGGFMYIRMMRMQQAVMQESLAARAEAEYRLAQVAQAAMRAREQMKLALFPNRADAIQNGDTLLTILSNPGDQRDVQEFVGKEVVVFGIGPGLRAGELDMIVTDTLHIRVQIDKSKVALPQLPGWSAHVLGKVVSIDRTTNTITLDVQPENWKPDSSK